MEKTFNILSYDHLVKLNNKAKKNNKNQISSRRCN